MMMTPLHRTARVQLQTLVDQWQIARLLTGWSWVRSPFRVIRFVFFFACCLMRNLPALPACAVRQVQKKSDS
jgi:hypothetical protein